MRAHRIRFVAMAVGALVLGMSVPVTAGHRVHFRDVYCDKYNADFPWEQESISRRDAQSYASTAIGDGYQWGGGCWDGDHVDDQPNDPPQNAGTGGEGGDCSGFVFKTWHLPTSTSNAGFQWWAILEYRHGPYASSTFKSASGAPLETVSKSSAIAMDAFAKDGHIGMLYSTESTPNGEALIIEACCEADGTVLRGRDYRSNSAYSGVRRKNWRPPPHVPDPCVGCGIEIVP